MKRRRESFQYLEFLKRTRQPRPAGELFCIKFRKKGYVAGRVIANNCAIDSEIIQRGASIQLHKQAHLIYIYKGVFKTTEFASPTETDELLIHPIICLTGWSQGYFLPLRVEKEGEFERLPVHCFSHMLHDYRKKQNYLEFCDEKGKKLSKCYQPSGPFGIFTHRGVEQLVAEAHGWPFPHSGPPLHDFRFRHRTLPDGG
ncbi:MAG: hypothetical protein LW650_05575 [Planctomycetaceae bacterium]|nr:hypothetical protein [Phycisphaerales bacterium]MCE2652974.1 hypothetical protein [Planctomycetaceae bacterium]